MAKRREFNVFSLSFLDIMSCGFGAVILIFIVIQHSTESTQQDSQIELLAEIEKLEQQIEQGTENLISLKNTLKETDDKVVTSEQLIIDIEQKISELVAQIDAADDKGISEKASIEALKAELKILEEDAASLKGSVGEDEASGSSARTHVGDGDRQYLTGVNLGGENILILLDTSASMLADTIVNIVRLRNMSEEQIRASEKWQRALKTIEWIIANVPADASLQLFTFSEAAKPIIPGSEASWIQSVDRDEINIALDNLNDIIPSGGTSLHHPFKLAGALKPIPDNIFLITDGLPTLGLEPATSGLIKSRQRVRLFSSAMDELPLDIPVNVILFPMEGDPIAAPSFWRLAQITGGSLLSPSKDWP
ncbi:MAG: VWA domain-containing protein [Pseudomonadales bacterium]|nr:VWA domain-containing protein [Pseudomonadales bacterium]